MLLGRGNMGRKLTPKQELQKLCNDAWKVKANRRWGDVCDCCGRQAGTFHHFVLKSLSLNLRYDILNAVPICTGPGGCHYKMHGFDPTEIHRLNDIIIKRRGAEWHKYIEDNRRVKRKHNVVWLTEVLEGLK